MNLTEEDRICFTRKRWAVLLASCLINLCIGSIYAFSVFSRPMAAELQVSSVAIAFTIANATSPITMILGGYINEKLGPRVTITIGGIMFGGGMLLSGFATSAMMLNITYGLGCGLGMSMVYGCTIGNSIKFFPDKRGLIGGIATASYGISSVLIPPVANTLIEQVGIRASFQVLGLVFIIVICISAIFVRACPAGFTPINWTMPQAAVTSAGHAGHDRKWTEMVRDPVFYVMLIMLTCGGVFGLMIISCASSIAQNMIGVSASMAATFVSILALFNTAGRIVAGMISDKIGRINTLTIAMAIALCGLALLYFSGTGDIVTFISGIALLGVCFGTFMGVFPGFTTDQFGAKYNTVNYGIMWIGFALAGVIGPTIVNRVYLTTGIYQPAFLVAVALALLGIFMTCVYRVVMKKRTDALSPKT